MSKLNDDLLNDYVDNILSSSKVNEINKIINEDETELSRLRAHKFVHQTLKEIPIEEAPKNISQLVMSKITETISFDSQASNFFKIVIGFFVIIISALLIYSFQVQIETEGNTSFQFFERFLHSLSTVLPNLPNIFSNSSITIIGSALIIILFIASFYMVESHFHFKKKLDHFSK
jgi:hypothetical protein